MKNKTLLILAAGMGSRFGGLKQVEPVGPNGELIIEYSIHDAIKNGFNKVVFIIKKENYELFKEKVGEKIEKKVKVEYVFQDVNDLPFGYSNSNRTKPWGTTHAVLCAKEVLNEPFLIINADDFYSEDSFKVASSFIDKNTHDKEYSIIAYKVANTITDNGSVKRGVCSIEGNKITKLVESVITKKDDKIIQTPLGIDEEYIIDPETLVSMNMMVLYPSVLDFFEKKFNHFLDENICDNSKESIISIVLSEAIEEGFCSVIALGTTALWSGITYKEDLDKLKEFISKQIENNIYPEKL